MAGENIKSCSIGNSSRGRTYRLFVCLEIPSPMYRQKNFLEKNLDVAPARDSMLIKMCQPGEAQIDHVVVRLSCRAD